MYEQEHRLRRAFPGVAYLRAYYSLVCVSGSRIYLRTVCRLSLTIIAHDRTSVSCTATNFDRTMTAEDGLNGGEDE